MKTKSIVVVLAAFLGCCASASFAQEGATAPLQISGNKTFITLRAASLTIPLILLDTGFCFDGVILYNPDYRDSLNLDGADTVSLGGAGSGSQQLALMLDSVHCALGNTPLSGQRIIVLLSDIYKGFPSNGIIGYSLFGHYAVEIDYDKNILVLHDPVQFKAGRGYKKIPLYFRDNSGIPWIDVSLLTGKGDAVDISAYIDFADCYPLVLLEKENMKFPLPEMGEEILLGRGLSGDVYGHSATVSKLIIGAYTLKNVAACVAPAEVRSKQKNADAVIGCGALSRFNLIFDYQNGVLYLKPNKDFEKPFTG